MIKVFKILNGKYDKAVTDFLPLFTQITGTDSYGALDVPHSTASHRLAMFTS